jgi:tetratricopeptide (TPR) repeat protein
MARLALALTFVVCFSLATYLQPRVETGNVHRNSSGSVLNALLGDSRRLFANHIFAKADAYFHGGYYPTIFDRVKHDAPSHLAQSEHAAGRETEDKHDQHEKEEGSFLGHPRDWIESFGRNFFPTTHVHLEKDGDERELLPWFRLAAELDPHRPDTYVTAAFWLRTHLGKVDEAEQFLREGLRQNPESYEILLELGRVCDENRNNPTMARNLWELALQKWRKQQAEGLQPDEFVYEHTLGFLAQLEEREGNLKQLLIYLEALEKVSPNREVIKEHIRVTKIKVAAAGH